MIQDIDETKERRFTLKVLDYFFEFQSGFSDSERDMIAQQVQTWRTTAGWDKTLGLSDTEHPANTIIKRASYPSDSKTLGEAVFRTGLGVRPSVQSRFAIPSDKWGVIFRDTVSLMPAPGSNLDLRQRGEQIRTTAVHEFGHLIGLGHTDQVCSKKTSVMTPQTIVDQSPTVPTANDAEAVAKLKNYRQ